MKLMYITNDPEVAIIAERSGVDRIFIDMEYIGKALRQGGMDTVQLHHTVEDIKNVRAVLTKAELLVRCNPLHEASEEYNSSEEEIEAIIESGADIIMLPYFKTAHEVREFVRIVDGRARTIPLVETREAVDCIDDILEIDGIDEIYIGLNDLTISRCQKFLFQPLADGTVDMLIEKFKTKNIPFGFGGIASLGRGNLPSEKVIAEHYRLGSTRVILSRSFCNTSIIDNIDVINITFMNGVKEIRQFEEYCEKQNENFFRENQKQVKEIVEEICRGK